MSRRLPIDRAYEAASDAITRACPRCGAHAGVYCQKPDGRLARIPCLARAKAAASEVFTGAGKNYRDYSEPLHSTEES